MAIKISGVTIIDDSRNIVSGAAATFTSNVTIGGTLTYEDVTNIDSVGVITAREGIRIPNTKQIQLGDSQELSFYNSTNTAHIQHTGSGFLFISGNDISLRSLSQKSYIVCDSDNEVSLYFNNSPKFQTTNTGVEVIHAGGGVLDVTTINATDGDFSGIVTATGFVGGGINTSAVSIFKDLQVLGGLNVSGVATANSFSGDGSQLTGITGGFFAQTDVGIHTLSKVGIGTTNPLAQLDVNVGSSVTAFNIEGSAGQLFSVTNNLSSGSIFEVNDITGLPSIDVNADGTIQLAPLGAGELIGIGTTAPTSKLHLVGDALVTGVSTFSNGVCLPNNSVFQIGQGSYKTTFHADGVNTHLCHTGLAGFFMKTNDFQITGAGVRSAGLSYDGTIFRARTGIVELGYEFGNGDAGIKLRTSGIGITVTGQIDTTDVNATGVGTFSGVDATGGTLERSSTGNKLMFVGSCETRLTHSSGSKICLDFYSSAGFLGRLDYHSGAIVLNNGGNKTSAVFRNAGGVELYYDNAGTSTKRFQTKNTGAEVVGILTATSITSPKYDGDVDRNIIMGCCAGIAITDTVTDACRNVIIGCSAGRKVCSGEHAVIIGACAGHELTCAGANVLIGEFAACRMCCGFNNVVIGKRAGMGLTGRTSCSDTSLGANSNTFLGSYAGHCMRRECNVVIGVDAGRFNENGQHNTWIGPNVARGPQASFATNCGYANVFLGSGAGYNARGGQYNVVIGRNVGSSISTGGNLIFIGCGAGGAQISGFNNIYMGNLAGGCVTTGTQSIFMGQQAGRLNVSGSLKIAIGDNAGEAGMGASETGGIAIGFCAQRCSTCGSGNVAVGGGAGFRLTCGQNIMMGSQTGVNATAAHGNTFLGHYAGGCFTTGQRNTIVGCHAGYGHTVGTFNVMLGACSGPRTCGAVGECNIFIGGYTASAMCCGLANVLIGTHAGQCLRNAYCNVFLGRKAGLGQTSGNFNFYVGNHAGPSNCGASGCDNVGLGRNTMRLSTGAASRNIAIGLQAGYCASGNYNIFFGCGAGELVTSGSRNIIIGCGVDAPSATGNRQLAIGEGTGRWITGDSSYNVCLAGAGVTATAAGTVCSCRVAANKYLGDCNSNVIFGGLAGLGVTLSNNIHHNVLLGCIAGHSLSTQCNVIAIGKNTAKCVHTGAGQHVIIGGDAGRYVGDLGCGTYGNVLIGINAGHCQVGACANVSIGVEAGRSVHGCSQMHCDINIGYRAGCLVKGGYNNVRIGRLAGVSNSTGIDNIMIGNVAGYHNLTGNDNIVMGESAGYCFCTGGSNIILGTSAGKCGVSQSAQVLIGNGAGFNQDGDLNVAVGYLALRCSGVAQGNVAIGACAMCGATAPGSSTGCCNIGIGYAVANKMSSGNRNTIIGAQAGAALTTGSYNIFFGMNAAQNLTTGSGNIVLGRIQAPSATGSNTLTIGCCACTWIKGDSSFNTTLAGITTAKSDGTFLVGAGVTLHARGEAAFAGVSTFSKCTTSGNDKGAIHLPSCRMLVFGASYIYGAIYQSGAQLTFQALNTYKFRVWDGGGLKDWMNVNGPGGSVKIGGCSAGLSGSTCGTHTFMTQPHKITMCSSVSGSNTCTKRFELDSYGIQLTGITTIAGNLNTTGIVTASSFSGDGSGLTGISAGVSTVNVSTNGLVVAGVSTLSGNASFAGGNVTMNTSGSPSLNASGTSRFEIASIENAYLDGSISHTGDTDTQISFDTDTIKFDTAGSERLRITSDGKAQVGSGVTIEGNGQATFVGVVTHSNHIDLPDDALLRLGVKDANPGGELTIEHSSSNVNYIKSPSSRTLQILGNGGVLMRGGGNENIAYFLQSSVKLYQNQGLKLETTSKGIEVGAGVTIETNGQATFVGVVTFGSSSTTIDGNSDTINVGTALTIGHTQGLQFHTQNLHSTGFEVNNLNISGVTTSKTINFATNTRANFASNNRLSIHSNGTNSYLDYAGSLNVRGSSGSAAALSFQSNSDVLVTNNLSISRNVNATGIITASNFAKADGTPIASTDIAINTLSSSSGTGGGSASFNGSAYRFTLSEPPDTSVYQLQVSVNGVIQKPNAGSSQPSEGFAIDGNDIIFGTAPPAGSPFFITTFKTVGISSIPPQAQVSTTSAAKSVKNVTTSTSAPTNSNGVDGDLWFTYIA